MCSARDCIRPKKPQNHGGCFNPSNVDVPLSADVSRTLKENQNPEQERKTTTKHNTTVPKCDQTQNATPLLLAAALYQLTIALCARLAHQLQAWTGRVQGSIESTVGSRLSCPPLFLVLLPYNFQQQVGERSLADIILATKC